MEIIIYNYDSIINELSQQITKIGSTPIGSYYPEGKTELVKFLSDFLPTSDVRGGSTATCAESRNIVCTSVEFYLKCWLVYQLLELSCATVILPSERLL